MQTMQNSGRSDQALRRHYEVEKELANRLRTANREDRKTLYRTVYNELFLRVPDHPQLSRKQEPNLQEEAKDRQLRLLGRFLRHDSVYLEIGAGDCHLAMAVARQVRHVYAVDVSDDIASSRQRPANFTLIISDGIHTGLPEGGVHVGYSHQLLEHLHPDDAAEQLKEIYKALAPGGVYICTTPHRFSGPHDISKFFDREATGFHLKEYTYRELRALFQGAGFPCTSAWAGIRGHFLRLPNAMTLSVEAVLGVVPGRFRKRLAKTGPFRALFDSVTIVAQKPWKN